MKVALGVGLATVILSLLTYLFFALVIPTAPLKSEDAPVVVVIWLAVALIVWWRFFRK